MRGQMISVCRQLPPGLLDNKRVWMQLHFSYQDHKLLWFDVSEFHLLYSACIQNNGPDNEVCEYISNNTQTLLGMWFLISAGMKINLCQ